MRELIERRVYFVGLGFSAFCLAYFYLLDHFVFSSSHFSPIFSFLLTGYDQISAWLALAIFVLAAFWKRPSAPIRLVDALARHPSSVALAAAALAAIGAIVVYRRYPVSMDEYAAIFQSKVFASGSIAVHLPHRLIDWLVVRGFNGSFLIASQETGRIIEAYWPGFAILLTPFQLFGAAWLCNAVLTGLALYLIHWITYEVTLNTQAAGWAMLFALASGAFFANGISFYSMQAHMTANLLFAALLIKPSSYRVFCAGLVGSMALIMHNPFPHTLFALPWIAAQALQKPRRDFLLLLAGYLPGLAIGLLWVALRSEISATGNGFGPLDAAALGAFEWPNSDVINMRFAAFVKMWIWAMPCLFALAFWGTITSRADSRVVLLATSAVLTFAGYMFVRFDQGHGWGYRYFQSAWGTIPILAGCAMSNKLVSPRMTAFTGASAILSLCLLVPLQIGQIGRFVSQHLAQLGAPKRPGNNIYFVRPLGGFYAADMIQFDPLLRDQDLILVSHGRPQDEELIRQNWPNATKVESSEVADQWYLGDQEVRVSAEYGGQFIISKIP
jgi:hypothetical protein